MTAKQPAVKKYGVTLSTEERQQLTALIQTGKRPARQVLKARILLKADASEAGEAWSDSQTPRHSIPASTPSRGSASSWWRAA